MCLPVSPRLTFRFSKDLRPALGLTHVSTSHEEIAELLWNKYFQVQQQCYVRGYLGGRRHQVFIIPRRGQNWGKKVNWWLYMWCVSVRRVGQRFGLCQSTRVFKQPPITAKVCSQAHLSTKSMLNLVADGLQQHMSPVSIHTGTF